MGKEDVLPAPSEHALLNHGGHLGKVFRISFKGHSANAKVYESGCVNCAEDSWRRVAAAAAVSPSDHVLRVLDVALMRQRLGPVCIALIYPPMDFTLRTWCRPGRRVIAPPEYRHIARSMLLGIRYLHSHSLVHADLTPCNVHVKGVGFGECAGSFDEFCVRPRVAMQYALAAASLKNTLTVSIADCCFCVPGSLRSKLTL